MSALHQLIEMQGKREALQRWEHRAPVEAAAAFMADEDRGTGYLYSGLCQAALPHRRLANASDGWQIRSDYLTLIVEPGMKPGNEAAEHVGVPYGSRARLIMLYLQSEALRTKCREVELGRSMRAWLTKMGVPVGGKSMIMIREQAERISHCRLSFHITSENKKAASFRQQNIVDGAMFLDHGDGSQSSLFAETARLSEPFFAELQRHPVPLEDAAIRAINNNSMALDLYAWLAYRLHALKGTTPVSWPALKAQFGTGFGRAKHFRATFNDNLRLALAVYPDAKVSITERGIDLFPSRPPVAPKITPALTIGR